jgi:hypothetical protein
MAALGLHTVIGKEPIMGHQNHPPTPTGDPAAGHLPAAVPLVRPRQPRIAVVGGSLTGPVLALLLLRAGFDDVAVYEANPDLSTATGGVLSLEHTALDVLDRLDIGQHEYVKDGFETITEVRGYARRCGGTGSGPTRAGSPPGPCCTTPSPAGCRPGCCTTDGASAT